MKVVLIDNTKGNARYLELNKVYDTVELTEKHKGYPKASGDYYIIDFKQFIRSDRGEEISLEEIWVKKKDMITLEEWRQQQLDKLI